MILMKGYVSLTTAAMKMAKRHFCNDYRNGCKEENASLGNSMLRILTGKKHCQMKLQRLQKVQIWVFALLVQQINSL